MGVVSVHKPMIGEKIKLTRAVPYFWSKNKTTRTNADSASTRAETKTRLSHYTRTTTKHCNPRRLSTYICWIWEKDLWCHPLLTTLVIILERYQIVSSILAIDNRRKEIPEIAGVSMPSPISIHMPSMAIKNNTLLATKLLSISIPSLVWFFKLWAIILLPLEVIGPIFMWRQSNEYRANVPPAMQANVLVFITYIYWSIILCKEWNEYLTFTLVIGF